MASRPSRSTTSRTFVSLSSRYFGFWLSSSRRLQSYFGRPIWTTGVSRSLRPFDSLILDGNIKAELLNELRAFMSSESWYHDNGVPYRCSYLLHGPSGTGKSA